MFSQNIPDTGLWSSIAALLNGNFSSIELQSRVVVREASDLSGTLDSTKEYFIDGIVDMGGQSIEVPVGGITLSGYNFNSSRLISSAPNYTMFTSPVGGSGDIVGKDIAIEVTGPTSQVYNLTDATGFNAFEFSRINYNNCTSLGELNGYRQGFESGTGRFGGTPELTLSGTWVGGFFIESSIVRGLSAGSYSLFKAGAGFNMASRFRTNQNTDLATGVSFFDFQESNFINPSTVQLDGCIVTRNGVFDADDPLLIPNLSPASIISAWSGNNGLPNTFVGGETSTSVEVTTVINTINVFEDLAGTFVASELQHFDSPGDGQLRHLGSTPREFSIAGQIVLDSTSNNVVDLKVVIFRDATSSFVDGKIQRRVINNLQGGRDVGYFVINDNIMLDQNDYVKLQVANASGTANMTAELDSFFTVSAR